jgi:hypothetical protein
MMMPNEIAEIIKILKTGRLLPELEKMINISCAVNSPNLSACESGLALTMPPAITALRPA